MVCFPFCKINLGLRVLGKRSDGYHEIETCFYPVPWTDILEILPSGAPAFTYTGLPIPGSPSDNLCARAYRLLKTTFGLPPIALHLHKIIPLGAGLGGGSTDGAFVLKALRDLFALPVSAAELAGYAAQLGSDCTFFLTTTPALASGRGDVVSPATNMLRGKYLVIVVPPIHIATAMAYEGVRPGVPGPSLSEVIRQPLSTWKGLLVNDFEVSIFARYPILQQVKEALYSAGARYASMSGSGAAVYGIFDSPVDPRSQFATRPVWTGTLS
jgi:4-diphosphocytidyl-2-C-methyl-D-erythritol kinase